MPAEVLLIWNTEPGILARNCPKSHLPLQNCSGQGVLLGISVFAKNSFENRCQIWDFCREGLSWFLAVPKPPTIRALHHSWLVKSIDTKPARGQRRNTPAFILWGSLTGILHTEFYFDDKLSLLPWKLKCAEELGVFCKGVFDCVYSGAAERLTFGSGTRLLVKPSRYLLTKDRLNLLGILLALP